jgi:hypothetical protein
MRKHRETAKRQQQAGGRSVFSALPNKGRVFSHATNLGVMGQGKTSDDICAEIESDVCVDRSGGLSRMRDAGKCRYVLCTRMESKQPLPRIFGK